MSEGNKVVEFSDQIGNKHHKANLCDFSNFLGAYYDKLENRNCIRSTYGHSYATIDEAKLACSNDTGCAGVWDNGCNGNNAVLYLIGVEFLFDQASCVYKKDYGGRLTNNHNVLLSFLIPALSLTITFFTLFQFQSALSEAKILWRAGWNLSLMETGEQYVMIIGI